MLRGEGGGQRGGIRGRRLWEVWSERWGQRGLTVRVRSGGWGQRWGQRSERSDSEGEVPGQGGGDVALLPEEA